MVTRLTGWEGYTTLYVMNCSAGDLGNKVDGYRYIADGEVTTEYGERASRILHYKVIKELGTYKYYKIEIVITAAKELYVRFYDIGWSDITYFFPIEDENELDDLEPYEIFVKYFNPYVMLNDYKETELKLLF